LVDSCIRETSEGVGVMIRAVGFMDDHVHLGVSIPPRVFIPKYVQELKTRSTHAVNRSGLLPSLDKFSWQREYGMFTFGRQSMDDVVSYVKEQRTHHKNGTIRPYFETTDSRDSTTPAPKERDQA
jgi:REP element-mobilizing transposase RayT